MSIISDALRKARERGIGGEWRAGGPILPRKKKHSSSSMNARPLVLMGFLVVLLAGFLLYPFAGRYLEDYGFPSLSFALGEKGSPIEKYASRAAGVRRGQYAVEEKPFFLGSDNSSFSLSGIAEFQDGYVAVINGQILRRGNRIQGATVVAITSQSVELDYEGERIILEKTF